jgi:hypothetical protein
MCNALRYKALFFDAEVKKLGGATFFLSTLIGPFLYFKIGSMGFFTLFNKGLIWYSI